MSYLDRIAACHRWHPDDYLPLLIDGVRYGRAHRDIARRLADFPSVFQVTDDAVALSGRLEAFDERNAAVAETMAALREAGDLPYWRDELYPVIRTWGQAPVLLIERGAVPWLGLRAFGVHMNGLVETGDGLNVWIAKRAEKKDVAPGKRDNLVAGGQPHGLSAKENLIKECGEEAGIPLNLAAQARPVGALFYVCEQPDGLRDDVAFCFDLQLAPDFEPHNTDGEVAGFELWPVSKVAKTVRDSDDFKFNSALVQIDLMVRHGVIGPDDPNYQAIVAGLHGDKG